MKRNETNTFWRLFFSVQSDLRVYNTHSSDSGGSSVSHTEPGVKERLEVVGCGGEGFGWVLARRQNSRINIPKLSQKLQKQQEKKSPPKLTSNR